MKDETLFLLSLFFSALGILALFFLSKNSEAMAVKPDEISGELVGKIVRVAGTVEGVNAARSFHSFDLCLFKCVKVVDFYRKAPPPERGAFVSVEGLVKEYRGELEVIADSIEVLN